MSAEQNKELAREITEISGLSYADALDALEAGGRPRTLALSVLQAHERFDEDRKQVAVAKEKLRELTAA